MFKWNIRIFPTLLWLFFFIWLLLQVIISVVQNSSGLGFIDFQSYVRAVDRLESVKSPYLSPSQCLEIWRTYHQDETKLLDAYARGKAKETRIEQSSKPPLPSAYVYPPTLALLILQLHISPILFAGLLLLSILGFSWLWLKSTRAHSITLLLIIFSWDVLASFNGGNAELLLIFTTLLAAWSLWNYRGLIAAPLIALGLLIKPFYVMFFVVFVLIQLLNDSTTFQAKWRTLVMTTVITLALVACEVYRWGPHLRGEAFNYFLHAFDYFWFVLPAAEQTPLSAWNRTPLQALVSLGLPLSMAKAASLGLWLLFVGITMWQARKTQLTFPLAFALALILLYWGRPVGWGLNYLEVVVVAVAWPTLQRWQKPVLISLVTALMVSHWWAVVLTAQGNGMPLLTLQSAEIPWETWLVLPLSWLLMLRVMSHTGNRTSLNGVGLSNLSKSTR